MSDDDTALSGAHETGIAAFLVPTRAARFRTTIGNPRGRAKIGSRLAHHAEDFVAQYATELSSSLRVPDIEELLHVSGALPTCYVLGGHQAVDGRLLDLREALDQVVFHDDPGVISCVPGRLALFFGRGSGKPIWLLRRTVDQ